MPVADVADARLGPGVFDEEFSGADAVERDHRLVADDGDECSGEVAADLELHALDLDPAADGDAPGVVRE